jgi:hypothetical protein
MTKPTITREESIQAVFDLKAGHTLGFADIEILKRVARMALTAMDSETYCKERKLFCSTDTARMRKAISVSAGTDVAQLYRHAKPAPAVPTFDEWLELSGNKPLGWVKDAMRESYDACRAAMLNQK